MNHAHMKNHTPFQLVLAILTGFLMSACGVEDGKEKNPPAETLYVSRSSIGSAGGVLSVADKDSSLYGVSITIPAGALSDAKEISIDLPQVLPELPSNYLAASSPVDFGPDGAIFNEPVEIRLPYNDMDNDGAIDGSDQSESNIQVIYYNESEKKWETLAISGMDTLNNTVTVAASHFSLFLVAISPTGHEEDNTGSQILSGEYFRGEPEFFDGKLILKGCINRKTVRCGHPYFLTIRYFGGQKPEAVIDRLPTTNTGPKVTIEEGGDAVTFDAGNFFEKVARSGNADLWQWQCEFNTLTHLANFDVLDDEDVTAVNGIYPEIGVIDNGKVRISWKFDLNAHFSIGDQIVIDFEAYYK